MKEEGMKRGRKGMEKGDQKDDGRGTGEMGNKE